MKQPRGEREHRAKVHANENKVIDGARELDRNDTSESAEYIREVAADIIARRAADN